MAVLWLLVVAPMLAWLGALAGIGAAKILRRPVRYVWMDALLGVLAFWIGYFAYLKAVQPVNGVGADGAAMGATLLVPAAHQWVRSLIATSRQS